jgi:starch-binding outer membrane protein, SusD/RagB family
MKKKYILFILILAVFGLWNSCKSDYLTVAPTGSLDQGLLQTTSGLDALLVGAYSMVDGVSSNTSPDGWESTSSNWVYGSIRGMEANKGTDDGDQPDIQPIQQFNEDATNPYLNYKWREVYEAISRTNGVITVTNKALAAGKISQDQATSYTNQARVLRGWYHFEAWRLWGGNVPYIDETVVDPASVTNTVDIRSKIIDDLTAGTQLNIDMKDIGRFNKTVSQVLLAKAQMQMNHDYTTALALLKDVVANGKKPNNAAIGLNPTYGDIFDIVNRNNIESVYTVQYSVNDGSGAWNAGAGEVLNFPYKSGASPGGCCGFFQPTQEFVNSFRTSGGLPLLDGSYNIGANQVKNDYGLPANSHTIPDGRSYSDLTFTPDAGPLDPRLDWAVGRRGIPYWDWGLHTGNDWIRKQAYAGVYTPKKQVYKKSQEKTYTDISSWTSGYTANGYRMIRFSDVLLLLAECQIETNDLPNALININAVRTRAANPAGWVKAIDPVTGANTAAPAANYVISNYATLVDQATARTILRMERKLELGMEGHRYYDLNRWGNTIAELSRVMTYEQTMPWGTALYQHATIGAERTMFPIPQRQIDLSLGKLVQNTGF